MDISGVEIAEGVRLLVPEDGSAPHLFHHVEGNEWCETVLGKRALKGSFDGGDLASRDVVACSGGHVSGFVDEGHWRPLETIARETNEEPTDG